MPSVPSRGRACQNCQSIKIKCELGAAGGGDPPCERCTRLGKSCILAAPKRQKDRVAELEAKVEALTKLLGAQGLQGNADTSTLLTPPGTGSDDYSEQDMTVSLQKKRKLEASTSQAERQLARDVPVYRSSSGEDSDAAIRLDQMVSIDLQQRVLDAYIASYQSILPVVPLQIGTRAEALRKTMPYTLNAIVYIASCGILSWDLQDQVNMSLIQDLTTTTLAQCKASLDLLQALQLACLWYRSPRNSTQIPLFQLVNIASDMVVDLGYGGLQNPPSLSIAGMAEGLRGGVVACRTWLISFIITETTAILRRRTNEQKWTAHHDQCLSLIETSEQSPTSEHLPQLAQHARATRLLASIGDEMDLSTNLVSPVVGTATCQEMMEDLQNRITTWRLQVPIDLWSSSLSFDGFYMEIILYEPVLHTTTNKESFAAPFLIERLSLTDFPAPRLAPHHIQSVYSLKSACHNLLDTATSFSDLELVSLPTMLYAPRIAHAAVTLIRLLISVTAEGNTYGQTLNDRDLNIESYLDKGLELAARASTIDSQSVMVRIMIYMEELKKWLRQYESSRAQAGALMTGNTSIREPHSEQSQDDKEDLDSTSAAEARSMHTQKSDQVPVDGVPYDDLFNQELAMDDFSFFELFPDNDWNATSFGT